MPIDVVWDNPEQTVLRLDFGDPWDWTDYHTAVMQACRMIESMHHSVAMIVSASTIDRLPQGALSRFRESDRLIPGNLGRIYVVTGSPLAQLLLGTLGKISSRLGKRLHLTQSLEEAHQHIDHRAIRAT